MRRNVVADDAHYVNIGKKLQINILDNVIECAENVTSFNFSEDIFKKPYKDVQYTDLVNSAYTQKKTVLPEQI